MASNSWRPSSLEPADLFGTSVVVLRAFSEESGEPVMSSVAPRETYPSDLWPKIPSPPDG